MQACALVQQSGARLRLPQTTLATATVILHRFLDSRAGACEEDPGQKNDSMSLDEEPMENLVAVCLYLAGKATEQTRKVRDVLNVVQHITVGQLMAVDDNFWALRKRIIALEQCVLRAINFDVDIDTPHRYLLNYCKALNISAGFLRLCWALLVDAMQLASLVRQPPALLAVATMLVASQVVPSDSTAFMSQGRIAWWQCLLDECITTQQLEEVGTTIAGLYHANMTENLEKEDERIDDPSRPKLVFEIK